jgi:hypothetical protein
MLSPNKPAACSQSSGAPMTRQRPSLRYSTAGTGSGSGNLAAAMSAAILGVACFASADQPAISRMFTKWIGRSSIDSAPSVCSFNSRNKRVSCVQATKSGSPDLAAR